MLNIMPQTMAGKKLLKTLIFGNLVEMPAEITATTTRHIKPAPISSRRPDYRHKVIYCAAHVMKGRIS
jgi:hypothetical protein